MLIHVYLDNDGKLFWVRRDQQPILSVANPVALRSIPASDTLTLLRLAVDLLHCRPCPSEP